MARMLHNDGGGWNCIKIHDYVSRFCGTIASLKRYFQCLEFFNLCPILFATRRCIARRGATGRVERLIATRSGQMVRQSFWETWLSAGPSRNAPNIRNLVSEGLAACFPATSSELYLAPRCLNFLVYQQRGYQ